MLGWGGVGGWGMFTYLVLRTWSIATLLRSLGSFTTLHVATLLMGWGGGVGDVHVPCTSYMILCYAAEISGIVYYVTCCYAADGVGWGGGGCSRTLYFVHDPLLRCWDLWDRLLRYMLLRCWWGGVGGWGMFTYLVLRTWSIATLLRSLGSFTTLHVATLLMGRWGGGGGGGGGGCSRTLYFVHDPLLRCWDLWDRLLRHMLLRCWWGGVGGWGMFTYLVLRTWSIGFSHKMSPLPFQALRKLCLWDLGHARVKRGGKPPPESWGKIEESGACEVVVPTTDRCRSVLLTDGARCYKRMSSTLNLLHGVVNHSAGQFTGELRWGREVIQVHTGTIDQVWSGCKAFIPKQLGSQSELIEVYLRAFQWRYINRPTLIRTKTIHQLNLLRKWRRKQSAQSVFW